MALAALFVRQLAALGALTTASWLVGRAVVRLPLRGRIERFAFFVGAGLGTLGVALFFLGLVGWLTPLAVENAACAKRAVRRAGNRSPSRTMATGGCPGGRSTAASCAAQEWNGV